MAGDPYATPAMSQWKTFKDTHPGAVLFFRMGDFYELFGDDAREVSAALGLTLTERTKGLPMAGVPHHQLDTYLKRAVDVGFRVAVCDQLEDASKAKGVVKRGVTRVVTAGTLVDEHLLRDGDGPKLAAVAADGDRAALAVVDVSTGTFTLHDVEPAGDVAALRDACLRLGVGELLVSEEAASGLDVNTVGAVVTTRPGWQFRTGEACEAVQEAYGVAAVEGFGLSTDEPATRAAGAIVRYLIETQAIGQAPAFGTRQATLAHPEPPRRESPTDCCVLDVVSLRALEVVETMRGGAADGALLGVFVTGGGGRRTAVRTPMGRRTVRTWLCAPPIDIGVISARHDAVGQLAVDTTLAQAVTDALDRVQDIARIAGRLALGRATPRDLVGLGVSLAALPTLAETLDGSTPLAALRARIADVAMRTADLAAEIARCCVDEPPAHMREGGLIRDGVDAELDEARSLQRDSGAWLAEYQAKLTTEHDLPGLKVAYNKIFGYYIELPTAQARRAPPELSRKQTLKNAERFTTPELHGYEQKVMRAEGIAIERERAEFDRLCSDAQEYTTDLRTASETLGELDALGAFAAVASRRGWVRPTLADEPVLEIEGGRHPVLDELLAERFVPNGATLGTADQPAKLALITGPNMAGKSTYIRQCALLAVLAQAGSFVQVTSMRLGVCDRVCTRVGADDALHRGQSTFMVEMSETAAILNTATARTLVVLDEIGRGTSTLDGLSLAWAIAEELALGAERPRTLFATHYHELTDLADRQPSEVTNLHVAVRAWTGAGGVREIAFLHEIRPGRAEASYGVHVARLAGVPGRVVERAEALLESLRVEHGQVTAEAPSISEPTASKNRADEGQLGLFGVASHPALDRLREIKIETMTPLDAFDALRALSEQARN